ncbi:recombination-associated protein RdgC, partial [Escherichia coli]|nr:recombination-associated protein RdgC [Escherichia coli]
PGSDFRRWVWITIAPFVTADELLEQNSDIDSEDVAQRLDADFFLLTSEISCLVDALVNALGGEAKQ